MKEVTLRKVNGGIIWIEDGKEIVISEHNLGGAFYETVRLLAMRMGEEGMWKRY